MIPGIGHRVAEQPLHRRPGHRQCHSDKGAHQDPRQPNLLDHQVLGTADLGNVHADERQHDRRHVPRRYLNRPKAQRDQRRQQHQPAEQHAANSKANGNAGLAELTHRRRSSGLSQVLPPANLR